MGLLNSKPLTLSDLKKSDITWRYHNKDHTKIDIAYLDGTIISYQLYNDGILKEYARTGKMGYPGPDEKWFQKFLKHKEFDNGEVEKDGEPGEVGKDGEAGNDGEAGETGKVGEVGKAGETGKR